MWYTLHGHYIAFQTLKSNQTLPPSFEACSFINYPPNMESKKRPKKEAGHCGWVGGKSNKQRNLRELVLNSHMTSRSLCPPTRTLRFYVQILTGFSHIYCPDGLNNTLLSLRSPFLKQLLVWERWMECTFQGQGMGWGASNSLGPAHGSTSSHDFSMTSSNTVPQCFSPRCLLLS